MKLQLILSLVLSIWSCLVNSTLSTYTTTNVSSKYLKSPNPVLSSEDVHASAYEICLKSFPEGKLNPATCHYIYDGCTVACLVGIDEWHKLPNQIGNPCPFNLRGTCDTYGRCHSEEPVQLGELAIEVDQANLVQIKPEDQYYFAVVHIRNSSEPWPLASMDNADSEAHCITRAMPGPQAVWRQTCDNLSSYLFKDTSRIFLYIYAHTVEDPYNNVLIGSTSATIFEIVQGKIRDTGNQTAFQLGPIVPRVWLWLYFDFAPKNF